MSIGSSYWLTHAGYLYISLITDAYSHRIMGYNVAESLEAINCKAALKMVLQGITKKMGKSLIHHSDRGIQADPCQAIVRSFCSYEYIQVLKPYHVSISMTQNSDPLENAIA
jgi:transposase InsO family protein